MGDREHGQAQHFSRNNFSMSYLTDLVHQQIIRLGESSSAEFFGVSPSTVKLWMLGGEPVPLAAVEKAFSVDRGTEGGKVIEAAWEGKQVAFLLPQQKTTNPLTLFSLLTLVDRAKMATLMIYGDSYIIHSRNKLVAQFQKTGIPWSFNVDDDMVLPCGRADWYNAVTGFNLPTEFAGVHILNRLLSSGKTLIGGLYFGRNARRRPMFGIPATDTAGEVFAQSAPHDVIKQVPWCATGALLIHKSVYSDIQTSHPELAPQMEGDFWHFYSNSETEITHAVDESMKVLNDLNASEESRISHVRALLLSAKSEASQKRLRFGEDVTLCRRAAKAGHPAYVDFGVVCGHVGNQVYGPKRFALV